MVCNVDGCDREERRGGKCWAHAKRPTAGPPRARTSRDRAFEAALAYAEADTLDDAAFARAKDNLRKAIAACAPEERIHLEREVHAQLVRDGLARASASGVRLGRPSKVHPALVEQVVTEAGGIAKAAEFLRISVRTVFRVLQRSRSGRVS